MMEVILLRHGQTYWNRKKKMQGKTDIPLNETGREQARIAGKSLPTVDCCLTSPLSRARDTALLVLGEQHVPIMDEPLLVEQGYGLYEAFTQRIGFHWPLHPLYNYTRHPEKYVPAIGGESFEELHARAQRFLDEKLLPLEGVYERILVSAHGAILCAVQNRMFGVPVDRFWTYMLQNCGTRHIRCDHGQYTIIKAQ